MARPALNPGQRPTSEQFEHLTADIVTPVLSSFGFQSEETRHGSLWHAKAYRKGSQLLELNYELPDDYLELALAQDPDNPRGHPLNFICEQLGRPHERYRTGPGVAFQERLRSLMSLATEQLADILSGETTFRFTTEDAEQLLAKWRTRAQEFLTRLDGLLAPHGYLMRPDPEKHGHRVQYEFRQPRPGGWVSLQLEISIGYWGADITPYLQTGFDRADASSAVADGPASANVPLYGLAGEPYKSLRLNKKNSPAAVAEQFLSDFIRLGEPFFERK